MHIRDEHEDEDEYVDLAHEAWGWADRNMGDGQCRLPIRETFLENDLQAPAPDAPAEDHLLFELTVLQRAVCFQYAYRLRMHAKRPDLLQQATNVAEADEMLRRYGAIIALHPDGPDAFPLDQWVSIENLDVNCQVYRAMLTVVSEGYAAQLQPASAAK